MDTQQGEQINEATTDEAAAVDAVSDEDIQEAARIRRERERRKALENEALAILNEALGRIVDLGCDIVIETHVVGNTARHVIHIQAKE